MEPDERTPNAAEDTTRRDFLSRSLALGAGAVGMSLMSPYPALAASTLFKDSFSRPSTAEGWGKKWFNQRYLMPWGISQKKGFYDLPVPQAGAGRQNPNPVLVRDNDVLSPDIKAQMSSNNLGARFGLLSRAVDYGTYYAAYLDGDRLVVSFFGEHEKELASKAIGLKAGKTYWVRFKTSGTAPTKLQAKVWPLGQPEPKAWTISTLHTDTEREITKPGAFGFVFLHDATTSKAARIKVANFRASALTAKAVTPPRITYSYVGRIEKTGTAYKARVVAKTDIPSAIKFQMADNPRFRNLVNVEPDEKWAKLGVAKAWLPNLPANSTVYWRVIATTGTGGKYRSRIHSFRTAPAPGADLTFAFGSCTNFYPLSRSFLEASKFQPLLFAHLGDFGYAEDIEGGAATAPRKDCYQDRWTRMLARSSANMLHRNSAWIGVQDDHDYGDDNAWSGTVKEFAIKGWDEMQANGGNRFFSVDYGDVECFFTDVHIHSDDPAVADHAGHSLLGTAQKSWLKDAMRASTARLLLVFVSMPFWGAGRGAITWKTAFAEEREELMNFFGEQQGPNRRVVICAGNAHAQIINRHPDAGGNKDIYEFVSSGTDIIDSVKPENIPGDAIIDPDRSLKKVSAFGLVTLTGSANNRQVTLRSINSSNGNDVWPPLELAL